MRRPAIDPERTAPDERTQVIAWRLSQLRRCGFDPEDAALFASHTEIDLYEALRLVQRGCSPKTALRILL